MVPQFRNTLWRRFFIQKSKTMVSCRNFKLKYLPKGTLHSEPGMSSVKKHTHKRKQSKQNNNNKNNEKTRDTKHFSGIIDATNLRLRFA